MGQGPTPYTGWTGRRTAQPRPACILMITLKNIVLRRGTKVLLDNVSVTLNPGEKVGLVGRNGAGKSTLFALLNGTLHEDGGDFSIPKQWRMAQVAQNMPKRTKPPRPSFWRATPDWRNCTRSACSSKTATPATTTRSMAWPLPGLHRPG